MEERHFDSQRITRQRRFILDTIILGIVGALSAQLFTFLLNLAQEVFIEGIAGYQAPGLAGEGGLVDAVVGSYGLWLIPVVTTMGGLLAGVLVYSLAPEAEGHGTDTAVKAFHHAAGYIRARVPPLKMIASAITIGSGGAAGREGPTALIAGGVGSIYAGWTNRSDDDRRLLVLIGMAAGLSAIFRSPIGTAVFAIEVLYSDMESDVGALLYTMLGSIVAYTVNGLFVGFAPLFEVPALTRPGVSEYFWYIILGVGAGLLATLLPNIFYGVRDLFHRIPIPPHVKPAIGGLGVGLLALALPQILGGGYGWIQKAIDGNLAGGLMLTLAFAKLIAFALTVSSGGSGGVFAPTLYVGAMLGGALASTFNLPMAPFVVVGMGAVFSGAARVPLATMIMVLEMTDGFHLLAPAALTITLSYLVQQRLSLYLPYRSLYEMQVPGRPDSPAHQREHMEAALRLLHERRLRLPPGTSHLDLPALLATGIPIDLPDGKQVNLVELNEESPVIGRCIDDAFPDGGDNSRGIEVAAVMREKETLWPRPDLKLSIGDRLLVITAPRAWEQMVTDLQAVG